jgi:hypothetical protein
MTRRRIARPAGAPLDGLWLFDGGLADDARAGGPHGGRLRGSQGLAA